MARFYRIVKAAQPTEADFYSYERLGVALRHDNPTARRLALGISVYDALEHARERARITPNLGSFIAVIDLPDDGTFPFERSTRQVGHYSVWGEPAALLATVVAILPA